MVSLLQAHLGWLGTGCCQQGHRLVDSAAAAAAAAADAAAAAAAAAADAVQSPTELHQICHVTNLAAVAGETHQMHP